MRLHWMQNAGWQIRVWSNDGVENTRPAVAARRRVVRDVSQAVSDDEGDKVCSR